MLRHAPDSEEISLRDLKDHRKSLWRRFEANPNEIQLAARLRLIDDQIAEFNQQSDRNANKADDLEVAAVPQVGGHFLLLAVSQRRGN
jgi:hypothetical protein